jgi:hypothetical protein
MAWYGIVWYGMVCMYIDIQCRKLYHLSFLEVLYADGTLLLFTRNTRTLNTFLHAVESESQCYGLKLVQMYCHHKYQKTQKTWTQILGWDPCTP